MEKIKIILYGASGHSRVVSSLIDLNAFEFMGYYDDNHHLKSFNGIKVLTTYNPNINKDCKIVISIGDNQIRKKLSQKISHSFSILVSQHSIISKDVSIGEGTVVVQGAIIQANTEIGKHVIVNTKSSIDHDCVINNFVHVGPNATLCGGVSVGEGTLVGASSTILPGIRIGKWCVIGAGSVVVKDIPDNTIVLGNPAKKINDEK